MSGGLYFIIRVSNNLAAHKDTMNEGFMLDGAWKSLRAGLNVTL
jgi:hypothetical protein